MCIRSVRATPILIAADAATTATCDREGLPRIGTSWVYRLGSTELESERSLEIGRS